MPRLARTVAVGCAHHITQRGNNRQDVFFVDDDRRMYLELLGEQADRYGLEIVGYCLMRNHVHLVAVPKVEEALAKAVGRTHFRYAQYINRFHKRSGHLWQGRFYSCALDRRHFWQALKYIERNPVRARLCRKPWRYEWSSAAAHVDEGIEAAMLGKGKEKRGQVQPAAQNPSTSLRTGPAVPGFLDLRKWYKVMSAEQWRAELVEGLSEMETERLRLRTHTGRPLGSDGFLSKIETALGRRVRPLPRGRPKKEGNSA
jgi:putative transposase